MSKSQWHWCWVGTRQRVQRRGLPIECMGCRRFKSTHKCGLDPNYRTAKRDYPVGDCAGCTRVDQRKLATGPAASIVSEMTREDVDPSAGRVHIRKERTVSRAELRAGRARRKMILMVGVMQGLELAPELFRMLDRFGAPVTRRLLYDDLSELVSDHWLVRVKEDREKQPQHQRAWHWRYMLSPAIQEKMNDD